MIMGAVIDIGDLRPHIFHTAACPFCRSKVAHIYPAACEILECGGCGEMVPAALWDVTGWSLFYRGRFIGGVFGGNPLRR